MSTVDKFASPRIVDPLTYMAEPALKEVLEAVQPLSGGLDEVRRDVAEVRRDVKALDGKFDVRLTRVDDAIADSSEDSTPP